MPSYNSRLQMAGFSDLVNGTVSTATTLLSASLNWGTTANNGILMGASYSNGGPTYSQPLTFSQTFTYDGVNRLTGATDSGGWSRTLSYDAYGNMTPAGTPAPPTESFNGNNQIVGQSYDQIGNLLSVNGNTLAYDFDSHVQYETDGVSKAVETYFYEGDGHRAQKTGPNGSPVIHYVYDALGRMAAEYSSTTETPGCVTCYFSLDHLGSTRVVTDQNGLVVGRHDYLPFGEEVAASQFGRDGHWGGGTDFLNRKFTGKERDTESGLDYFGARYYASSMGRWMSPDKVNVTEDRMMNPSSTLNKYAYAANNPLLYTDPDGEDITIFYEPANLLAGSPGHTMLLAYDQSNGQSAIRSFGPDYANGASVLGTLGSTPGTDSFGFQNIHSPDDLRAAYKSITIQTSPEEAEAVIAEIKAHPDGNYSILSKNCTTTCSKILRNLGKTKSKSITPGGFFSDLCAQYGCHPPPGPNGHDLDQRGMMFGNPRPGYNPFQLFFNDIPRGNPEGTPKRNTDPPCLKNRDTGGCA